MRCHYRTKAKDRNTVIEQENDSVHSKFAIKKNKK